MKCRKCNRKAVINMRQHKLALCSNHYQDWIHKQVQRFIEKYDMFTSDESVLVAISGGKDSLALWDVLHQLGYQADGVYIDLGINGENNYSHTSHHKAESFAQQRGLKLIVVIVEDTEGATIPEAATLTRRGKDKPCSLCGLTKRHILNRVGIDGGYDVLATGHNLDDEAAVLFGNTLNWQVGYLSRQGPVLDADPRGFIRKVKPFCRFYERETAAYALLRGIDYIDEECPYAIDAKTIYYKEILNQLESTRPGLKLQFYLSFLKVKDEGIFGYHSGQGALTLHKCNKCGQPTSAPIFCAFCRTWEQVRSKKRSLNVI